jgi:hypothetical protein
MANRNLLIDVGENTRFEAAFLPANCTITGSGKTLTRSSGVKCSSACRAGISRKRGHLSFVAKVTGSQCALGIGTTFASNAVNIGGDAGGETWAVWFGAAGANVLERVALWGRRAIARLMFQRRLSGRRD